jgi:hypothetical protein
VLKPYLVFRLMIQLRHELDILDQRAALLTRVVSINIFNFRDLGFLNKNARCGGSVRRIRSPIQNKGITYGTVL